MAREDAGKAEEDDYHRISLLAQSLKRQELLTLGAEDILHRLFWQERVLRFEPQAARFACSCSCERVAAMIVGLGQPEAEDILREQGQIEVGCDFCGRQYRFDAVDAARIFTPPAQQPQAPQGLQ